MPCERQRSVRSSVPIEPGATQRTSRRPAGRPPITQTVEIPRIVVLNKVDLVSAQERERLRNRLPDAIQVSAHTREGLDELEIAIAEHFAGRFEPVELLVPYADGATLSALYALGAPISHREDTADGVRVIARLPAAERDRYARFRVDAGVSSGA